MSDAPLAANPERGEAELVVNGRTYVLKLSMNAAVTLEKKLSTSIGKLWVSAGELSFTAIREILFVLLQKYHAQEFKNTEKVGDLIDEAGGVAVFFDVLAKMGEHNAEGAPGQYGNPPQTQGGTGDGST